jgi:phage/plasmid-like protein (TIGR03299 family)
MAHEIEGNKFVGTQVAWHRIGTVVEKAMTAQEAMVLAGLDTTLHKQTLYVEDYGDGYLSVPDKKGIVRMEDGKVLGVVGDGYEIIQNRDCFDFMDGIIGEGRAVYETAGSLRGGSRIFLTVKMANALKIGPDKIDKYLCLSTSHDMSLALRVHWTPVRVVCQNTLSVALKGVKHGQNAVAIRHTKHYRDKVAEARRILGLADEYYAYMEQQFNKMLNTHMSDYSYGRLLEKVFPIPEKGSARIENIKNECVRLFIQGAGHENIKNTHWAGYNAIVEYADHGRSTRIKEGRNEDEVRMETTLWGSGAQLKQKAFDLCLV